MPSIISGLLIALKLLGWVDISFLVAMIPILVVYASGVVYILVIGREEVIKKFKESMALKKEYYELKIKELKGKK